MELQRVSKVQRDLAREQVAFLTSEGLTQKRIAATLGYSQSTVSLLLKEAINAKNGEQPLLDPRPRLLLNDSERVRIQNSLYVGELEAVLNEYAEKHRLRFVPKIYLGHTESDNQSWDIRTKIWGQALAPTLLELIHGCDSIAVSWGRQLRSLIDGMKLTQYVKDPKKKVDVFTSWPPRLSVQPESEDTIYRDHIALESNALAYDLSQVLNSRENALDSSLHYLPGIDFVPFTTYPFDLNAQISTEELKEWIREEEKFLHGVKSALFNIDCYKRIFGSYKERTKECLLYNADAAIVPVGPPGGAKSFAMDMGYGGIPKEWFKDKTNGDIGGVLLPAKPYKKLSPKDRLQFERVRMRWLGLQESDLKHIARNGKVGTIVGAVGDDRTPALVYGIKNHLIRHLFCDHSVAKALHKVFLDDV